MATGGNITRQTENYYRLAVLTAKGCTEILRALVLHQVELSTPPGQDWTLDDFLQNELTPESTRKLSPPQKSVLFPFGGCPTDIKEWDLSLLAKFLLDVCQHVDNVVKMDVRKMKDIRNNVCHCGDASIADGIFTTYFKQLKISIERCSVFIGNDDFKAEMRALVHDIEYSSINTDESVRILTDWYENDKRIGEQLDRIEQDIQTIKSDTNARQDKDNMLYCKVDQILELMVAGKTEEMVSTMLSKIDQLTKPIPDPDAGIPVSSTIDEISPDADNQNKTLCDPCSQSETPESARTYCPQCDSMFCDGCIAMHDTLRRTKNHRPVPVEEAEIVDDKEKLLNKSVAHSKCIENDKDELINKSAAQSKCEPCIEDDQEELLNNSIAQSERGPCIENNKEELLNKSVAQSECESCIEDVSKICGSSFEPAHHETHSTMLETPISHEDQLVKAQQKLMELSVSTSTMNGIQDKVSIINCVVGDLVLLCLDEGLNQYVVFTAGSTRYFLHTDCLDDLSLRTVPGEPRKQWLVAEITDKEYCLTRKFPNRFMVPIGTKFYRVKAKKWVPESQATTPEKSFTATEEIEKSVSTGTLSGIEDKVSIMGCRVGDLVLLCLDEGLDQYIVFTAGTVLHFLHTESFDELCLKPVPGEPRKQWLVGEITDKEYCQARKPNNRFRVPAGTKFYRVKANKWGRQKPSKVTDPEMETSFTE